MDDTYELGDLELRDQDIELAEQKVSPLLGGAVVFLLVMIFVLIGLIIKAVFFSSDIPRTQIEKDLVDAQSNVKSMPSNPDAHLDLGLVYSQLGQTGKAMEHYNQALKLNKNYADAYHQIGRLYLSEGKDDEAIKSFNKAVEINPSFAVAQYELGSLAFKNKKYEKAAEYYKKTIEANSMLADPYYYLGVCYEKLGKKDLAKKQYEEALKFVPEYQEAKEALERVSKN